MYWGQGEVLALVWPSLPLKLNELHSQCREATRSIDVVFAGLHPTLVCLCGVNNLQICPQEFRDP